MQRRPAGALSDTAQTGAEKAAIPAIQEASNIFSRAARRGRNPRLAAICQLSLSRHRRAVGKRRGVERAVGLNRMRQRIDTGHRRQIQAAETSSRQHQESPRPALVTCASTCCAR